MKHLSVDSDADADLVKIYGLTWMKYLGIRTSLVTMHAPWVVHTTAVGQRRRNYDVTITRHQTLRFPCLAYHRRQSTRVNSAVP